MLRIFEKAERLLATHLATSNIDAGHGMSHAKKVQMHAVKAILTAADAVPNDFQFNAIVLAALLHDADDRKFFSPDSKKAHQIVMVASADYRELADLVQQLIDLVSASKNKNSTVAPNDEWMLIPRHADRLEAIGKIGIVRAYQYAIAKGNPFSLPSTPRVTSMEELNRVAPPSRFASYNGNSASMIDHFYDKIVHLGPIDTDNKYFFEKSNRRMQIIYEFLFEFGRTGVVNEEKIKHWEQECQ